MSFRHTIGLLLLVLPLRGAEWTVSPSGVHEDEAVSYPEQYPRHYELPHDTRAERSACAVPIYGEVAPVTYETEHFIIGSSMTLEEDVLVKFGKLLELSRLAQSDLLSVLLNPGQPLGVVQDTSQKRPLRLYRNKAEYVADLTSKGICGAAKTDGMCVNGTVLLPSPSVGITEGGKAENGEYLVGGVVLHELNHQEPLSSAFRASRVMVEGIAVYAQCISYEADELNFDRHYVRIIESLNDELNVGKKFADFMTISYEDWTKGAGQHDYYPAALAIVTFLIHLDGSRGRTALQRFLQQRRLQVLYECYGGSANLEHELVRTWQEQGVQLRF